MLGTIHSTIGKSKQNGARKGAAIQHKHNKCHQHPVNIERNQCTNHVIKIPSTSNEINAQPKNQKIKAKWYPKGCQHQTLGSMLVPLGYHFGLVRRTRAWSVQAFGNVLSCFCGPLLRTIWIGFSEHSAGLPACTLFGHLLFLTCL
jgi:hypothetical protein